MCHVGTHELRRLTITTGLIKGINMSVYIRVVDNAGLKSPILRIHNDEEEFLGVIKKWQKELATWVKLPGNRGLPLGCSDASTAIVDLLRELTKYYVETDLLKTNRIRATFRLYEEKDLTKSEVESITEIKV